MVPNSSLIDLPQSVVNAAFDGRADEVIRHCTEWLRQFTQSTFVVIGTTADGSINQICQSSTPIDYFTSLDTIPVGRGTIYLDDDGKPRAIYSDERQPSFARPERANAHFLGLPIYSDGGLLGIAYVSRPIAIGQYSWREQLCLCKFTVQVAQAIEIARSLNQPSVLHVNEFQSFVDQLDEFRSFFPYDDNSLEGTLRKVTKALSNIGDVQAAHIYLPAPDGLLVPTNRWHDTDTQRYMPFLQATARNIFAAGYGLPGRVLTTDKAALIPDVTYDTNFPRVTDALPVGIRGATAVPVRHDSRITAVVECFFTRAIDDDSGVLAEVETLLNQ